MEIKHLCLFDLTEVGSNNKLPLELWLDSECNGWSMSEEIYAQFMETGAYYELDNSIEDFEMKKYEEYLEEEND